LLNIDKAIIDLLVDEFTIGQIQNILNSKEKG